MRISSAKGIYCADFRADLGRVLDDFSSGEGIGAITAGKEAHA